MPIYRTGVICSFWVFAVCCMHAGVDDYSPFAAEEHPASFKVIKWVALSRSSILDTNQHFEFAESASAYPHFIADWVNQPDAYQIRLCQSNGTVIFSTKVNAIMAGVEVYSADLNGDKVPDYIIATNTGTNGLGPDQCLTFLLSTPKGYVVQSLVGNGTDPTKDFIDLKHDGHPQLLYTLFVPGEKGKDGKVHNYWVHNLIGFEGGNLVSANAVDQRFPDWILYTLKPNHSPESQLSAEQRSRLWAAQYNGSRASFLKESVPVAALESLVKEQAKQNDVPSPGLTTTHPPGV